MVKEDTPQIRGMVHTVRTWSRSRRSDDRVDASRSTTCARLPAPRPPKTRVGRGEGGKGKTAGRGTKGTKARKPCRPAFEGGQMPLHMRLPKLKGFKNRFRTEYQVVNVGELAELFPEGGEIGSTDLVEAGAVRRNRWSRCSARASSRASG